MVHNRLEVLVVVCAGGIRDDLADELMRLVDVHRELVAMMALVVLLRLGVVQILLAPLGHGFLAELRFVVFCEVLPGR